MKNLFQLNYAGEMVDRVNKLTPESKPLWGTMNVAQMLAHCNVTYDMIYTDKYPPAKGLKRFFLKLMVKPIVVGDKPYKHNSPTAPAFKIVDQRQFEVEKQKLITHITQTQRLGEVYFEGRESNSFGPLTAKEWNVMCYKHLDHHLNQFGC
ncbi:MAG: DUF1569 domain-containing protein [Flavobacteriales bacterium]